MLGYQQREVRILRFLRFILVTVAVHRYDSVRILRDDRASRIHAECPDQILILLRLIDDLALIYLVRNMAEHLRGQFDPGADVHPVGKRGDLQLVAETSHPCASASPDGYDALPAGVASRIRNHFIPVLRYRDIPDRLHKAELRLLFQIIKHGGKNVKIDIRPEMPDGRVQQMQSVLQARCPEIAVRSVVQLRAAAAVLDIDRVDIMHQLQRPVLADMFVQGPAEFIRDIVFPVGERAGSPEPFHDGTAGAVYASRHGRAVDGAVSLFERSSRLKHNGLQIRSQDGKLIR